MPTKHVVQPGEHIAAIARANGFENATAIVEHPDNAELFGKREKNILLAGDELTIPDLVPKAFDRAAGSSHTFNVTILGLELHLQLLGHDFTPLAGDHAHVSVDGQTEEVPTDGAGKLVHPIDKTATAASVLINNMEYSLRIGSLDPIDEEAGQLQRLNNLGYPVPLDEKERDPDDFRSAVEEFQLEQFGKGGVNGQMDAKTQDKLKEVHGC